MSSVWVVQSTPSYGQVSLYAVFADEVRALRCALESYANVVEWDTDTGEPVTRLSRNAKTLPIVHDDTSHVRTRTSENSA